MVSDNPKEICKWCGVEIQETYLKASIYDPTTNFEERRQAGAIYYMHQNCVYEAVMEAVELVPSPGRDKRPSFQRRITND